MNSTDLEKTSRNRLETLSCPKLFPIEETSKLSFPVGTYRQTSKSARNSPVSLRPELMPPSSSRLGIYNITKSLQMLMLVTSALNFVVNIITVSIFLERRSIISFAAATTKIGQLWPGLVAPQSEFYTGRFQYHSLIELDSNSYPLLLISISETPSILSTDSTEIFAKWKLKLKKVECDHYTAISTAPFMVYPPKIWFFHFTESSPSPTSMVDLVYRSGPSEDHLCGFG